ncbi:sulfotransferase domain-containing protein [Algoriphagus sp. SE2]|uniref:sulfotransferase domain-containing protein n=1 Tax=Algoriphagus sp. SE2 TaxID=3141536 RepID=UPI0031CCE5A4
MKKLIELFKNSPSKKERNLEDLIERNFLIPIEEFSEKDIFIVGYPKSGNTWMQSLISGLVYGISTEYLPESLAQELVPDVHARTYYKRFSEINFFKSHNLPDERYRRVIYLVRDGRDVMVSYENYLNIINKETSMKDMITEGKNLFPCKWDFHVREWMENPYHSDMIIIRYEDLLEDPINELKKVCEFANIERDELLLKRIVEGCHIEKMRKRVSKSKGMAHKDLKGEKGVLFFNQGKSKSYKDKFEKDLLEYFESESKNELELFNYV